VESGIRIDRARRVGYINPMLESSNMKLRAFSLLALSIMLAGAPADAQNSTPRLATEIERTPDGKPKLDGIWQALEPANWDIRPHAARSGPLDALGASGAVPPGIGIVEGDEIPYQPWAFERQRENEARQLELDPEVRSEEHTSELQSREK